MSIQLEPIPALVVIDLQSGVVAIPCAHPMEQIIASIYSEAPKERTGSIESTESAESTHGARVPPGTGVP